MGSYRDLKYKGFANNPLVSQGQKALEQCVSPLMDTAKLRRCTINKFDDKGRPDSKIVVVDFQCIITPDGPTVRRSSAAGDRTDTHYSVMYLSPAKLQSGDVLEHATFGLMKIIEFDGLAKIGLTTARAVKLNSGHDIVDGDAVRLNQGEMF